MKEKRMIKIASLNLWRFNEWERRLPLIVESIKKVNPDIIFFQEMQTDISFDKRNQLDILNSFLKYPHQMFTLADIKTKRKGVPLSHPVDHGLGVLSKFEFSTDKIMLTKAEDDKEQRILQVNNFNIDGQGQASNFLSYGCANGFWEAFPTLPGAQRHESRWPSP